MDLEASAPDQGDGPASGRPLDLLLQHDYTNGGCASFARAASQVLGGKVSLLYALDPRQLAEHDHPRDMPLCLHVFVEAEDGGAVDAEGRRPIREMARSFGVRRGYKFRISSDPADLAAEFPVIRHEMIAEAAALIREHGWQAGVPEADESLTRNWKDVTRRLAERAGHARAPTAEEARLYNLLPGHQAPDWRAYERLEIRPDTARGFVVVALARHPYDDDLPVTASTDEEAAAEVACELEIESGLAFDLDAFAP